MFGTIVNCFGWRANLWKINLLALWEYEGNALGRVVVVVVAQRDELTCVERLAGLCRCAFIRCRVTRGRVGAWVTVSLFRALRCRGRRVGARRRSISLPRPFTRHPPARNVGVTFINLLLWSIRA